jgi:glyoxylase-like metal-dependent hydrolase (beta-lactamase superfamily II)
MKLHLIDTGTFKLDGGAMFGVVPKVLWQKLIPPDVSNRIELGMRCLLIETEDRLILVDTGIGNKQKGNFIKHFSPLNTHLLLDNLHKKGFSSEDITDVILTHLHFDHVGGAICLNEENRSVPAFPKANYWVSDIQWNAAVNPTIKEAPSFIKDNFIPLKTSGQLQFIPCSDSDYQFIPGLNIRFVHGHTLGMMLPVITIENQTFVYCADLIPTIHHLSLSYIIAYDIQPLETIKERSSLIEEALKNDYVIILEHDVANTCVKLIRNENGKIQAIPYFF